MSVIKRIQGTLLVDRDGNTVLVADDKLVPGEHRVTVLVEPEPTRSSVPLDLPILNLGPWRPHQTFRREDMHDDDGR